MSHAAKCDKCGNLFVRAHGCVVLDVAVAATPKADKFTNWTDVDLCPYCSKLVLDVIQNALQGLKRPRMPPRRAP